MKIETIHFDEFLNRAKAINVKVKHDGDYALKLYHDNKIIVTVMKQMKARMFKDNYYKLPQYMKQEIHAITYWLDHKTITNKGGN